MRSGRADVHLGGSLDPIFLTTLQQVQAVELILHHVLREAFDVNALELLFSNLEWILSVGVLEKIIELLVVDLEKRTIDGQFQVLGSN